MSVEDARFEDGGEQPLNLGAWDLDDLKVLSALAQDAVFPASEMRWERKARRFALLFNRFRWEDAARTRRSPERVQSVLAVENVLGVASQGVERGEDGTGHVLLTLAGDGAIRLAVEALELRLRDVTRPYLAPSGKAPDHGA